MNECEIASALNDRRLDVAFMTSHTLWPHVAAVPIYRERLTAALPLGHVLAEREAVDWTSLRDETFLVQGWMRASRRGNSTLPFWEADTATTFVLMRKTPKSAERSDAALAFFSWGLHDGARSASDLGYVPLPASLVNKVQTYWKSDFHFGP